MSKRQVRKPESGAIILEVTKIPNFLVKEIGDLAWEFSIIFYIKKKVWIFERGENECHPESGNTEETRRVERKRKKWRNKLIILAESNFQISTPFKYRGFFTICSFIYWINKHSLSIYCVMQCSDTLNTMKDKNWPNPCLHETYILMGKKSKTVNICIYFNMSIR